MTAGPRDSEPETSAEARADRERVERAVRNLQAGHDVEGSFDFLFQRFSPSLVRQFIRWGAAAEEARDLNQETFQGIFRDMESFRGGDPLFGSWVGWIWKIARTSWLRSERYKRAAKRPRNPQPLAALDQAGELAAARAPGQLDDVLVQEHRERVRRAIDELPEKELRCVILYYYQGLRTREISVILRIAQGTVKAHLSHARAKLRAKLGGKLGPDVEPDAGRGSKEQRV